MMACLVVRRSLLTRPGKAQLRLAAHRMMEAEVHSGLHHPIAGAAELLSILLTSTLAVVVSPRHTMRVFGQ
jgi:hypothetical protein